MIDQILNERCSCVDALSFFFDFNDLEVSSYFVLIQNNEMTTAELCEILSRNQSTVYTAVEKLVHYQLVIKKKRGRKGGGYEFVYKAKSPGVVKQLLMDRLDKLYEQMSSCLQGFENESLSQELPINAK